MDENPINNYSGSLLMEIAIYCSKNNLSYQVIPGDGLHLLDEYYMDYAISLTGVLDDISKYTKTKFVFINTIPPGETGVKSDNFTPIRQASEYLYERGRRRLGIVLPNAKAVSLSERIAAFEESVKNLEIPQDHCAVIELCKMDDFENFSKKMRNHAIDGLIVAGEAMPLQISYFLDLLNLKVPADVSVISYEVEHFSQYLIPPHTTIKQDFKTLVEKAFKMLMSKDAGKRKGDVIVPCSFIERDSVSTKI
jgi:DNA-binding LacI/PurR family transcriptional regulator